MNPSRSETCFDDKVKFAVRIHQGGYSFEELKRIWTEADRLGYHSATLYDLLNVPTLECWTTLSALAAVTERIRLTPLTLANPYRPPALLAKMASTLDVISGGRLELGIGAGGDRGDHLASGYEFPSTPARTRMLDESVEIIKRLWTEPSVDFNGRYYSLSGAVNDPKPVQQPRPPVLIGGRGEAYVLRSVAKHADYCNWGFDMTLEEHQAKLQVLERHCHEVGRCSNGDSSDPQHQGGHSRGPTRVRPHRCRGRASHGHVARRLPAVPSPRRRGHATTMHRADRAVRGGRNQVLFPALPRPHSH